MKINFWNYVFACAATFSVCNFVSVSAVGQTGAFDNFSTPRSFQTEDENELPAEEEERPSLEREDLKPQQTIVVQEDRAGWNEAGKGISRGRLSDQLRSHWVMVDSNGLLLGTVIGFDNAPIIDAKIHLLSNGTVVSTTNVNAQGQFSFNNVQEGTYGLVGIGDASFFAFGFNAIRNSNNPRADAPRSITVMAGPNQTSINTDWINHFGPEVKFRVYGRFESREGTKDPARLYGTEGIGTHYPAAYPATTIQSHAVTSFSDGRLAGRVHQIDSMTGRPVDVRNIRVMMLKNNDVYAATSTDNFGVFDFTQIPPGFYTLVAAGDDGMSSIGLEVVPSDRAVDFLDDEEDEDEDEDDDDSEMEEKEKSQFDVVPIDIALMPSENSGWLVAHANEFAYQRAISRSARINAQRNACNCPPVNPQDYQAILEAIKPSDRGQFWKKINQYFDDLRNGEDSSRNSNQQQGRQQFQPQQQFQQPFQQQFQQPVQQPVQQQFQQPVQQQFQQPVQHQFQQPVQPQPLQPVQHNRQLVPQQLIPQSNPVQSRSLSIPGNLTTPRTPQDLPGI